MTPLQSRILRMIAHDGPMPLAQYMHLSLADPADGYYANRQAIGAAGDFITAPEVSQLFGEMIGIWCVAMWRAMGEPQSFVLAEAGPGRGTLFADVLRTASRFADFQRAARPVLIETSPAMIRAQRQLLARNDVEWVARIGDLPSTSLILFANELLDVLPIRQFVKSGPLWRERGVTATEDGQLQTVLLPNTLDPVSLPAGHENETDGAVFEHAPAREAWIAELAARLEAQGGAALLIDYGHAVSGFGDTFQAMRGHGYADPFAQPGLADLTAHVDFAALVSVALDSGVTASPIVTQGDFLSAMGIAERAGALGATVDEAGRDAFREQVMRLVDDSQMGQLFKVLALADVKTAVEVNGLPPFSASLDG